MKTKKEENTMKKINILIALGLFFLLVGTAQPAQAVVMATWAPSMAAVRSSGEVKPDLFMEAVAQLNAASSKFEGLLNAYSASRVGGGYMPWAGDYWPRSGNLFSAASDLSSSQEEFNTALIEVYPTLSEEEQLVVGEAYSSLGLYLEDLVVRTNSVFGKEVLTIEYQESDGGLWTVNAWTLFD